MNVKDIFSVKIGEVKLDLDMKEVEKFCYDIKNTQIENVIKSNMGGFQSSELNLQDDFVDKIVKEVLTKSIPYLEKYQLRQEFNYSIVNMWININGKKDFNMAHTHPNCIISGCFYIKSNSSSGNIVFEHPIKELIAAEHEIFLELKGDQQVVKKYPPHVGIMYLFPSWLRHYVEQNTSDEDRISIAFNIARVD